MTNKAQPITHGIVHAGFRGLRAFVAHKIVWCIQIGNRFVVPHDTIPSNVSGKLNNSMQFKSLILFLITYNYLTCIGQTTIPFYQQLAFEFYKDSIFNKTPHKKKFFINSSTYNFRITPINSDADCLKNKLSTTDSAKTIESKIYLGDSILDRLSLNLDKDDRKVFKIKSPKNYFPKLIFNYPLISEARIFVVIQEDYESNGNYYTLEFDQRGSIVDWCKSSWKEYIVY